MFQESIQLQKFVKLALPLQVYETRNIQIGCLMFKFIKHFFYMDEVKMSRLVSLCFVSLVFGILHSCFNPSGNDSAQIAQNCYLGKLLLGRLHQLSVIFLPASVCKFKAFVCVREINNTPQKLHSVFDAVTVIKSKHTKIKPLTQECTNGSDLLRLCT